MHEAGAQLAQAAERQPEVEADLGRGAQELRDLDAVAGVRGTMLAVARDVGGGEPVRRIVDVAPQRVVDLGEDRRALADLDEVAPLGAVLREPVQVVAQLDVEAAVAAEVGMQVQAHAQVVGAPGLVLQVEHQRLAVRAGDEPVVGAGVVAAGRQPARVGLGLPGVEQVAGLRLQLGLEAVRVGVLRALELHRHQRRRLHRRLHVLREPLRVLRRRRRIGRDPIRLRLREVLAHLDQLGAAAEVAGGQLAEIGVEQQVVRLQRGNAALDVLLGQDRDHLLGDAHRRRQRLAPRQRRADVDDDHHVDAHRARDVHRQVVHQAAVAQDVAVDLGGREHARHAHAGAQRHREIAVREHDRLAGFHVGGHGAERDRQVVEIVDVAHRQREATQQQLEAAAGERTLRRAQLAGVQAEFEAGGDLEVLFLAPLRQVGAWHPGREQRVPVDVAQLALESVGAHAAGVESADDRAHRRAGDRIDADVLALQHLQHADMREPARAAAREHEADARAAAVGVPRQRGGRAGGGLVLAERRGRQQCGRQHGEEGEA